MDMYGFKRYGKEQGFIGISQDPKGFTRICHFGFPKPPAVQTRNHRHQLVMTRMIIQKARNSLQKVKHFLSSANIGSQEMTIDNLPK